MAVVSAAGPAESSRVSFTGANGALLSGSSVTAQSEPAAVALNATGLRVAIRTAE